MVVVVVKAVGVFAGDVGGCGSCCAEVKTVEFYVAGEVDDGRFGVAYYGRAGRVKHHGG